MNTFRILVLLCILIGTAGYCVAADSNSVSSLQETRLDRDSQSNADQKFKEAIQAMDVNGIKATLEAGANPNLTLNNGMSALGMALFEFEADNRLKKEKKEEICLIVLNTLFDAGAKIQPCDKSVLFHPIADGFPKVVELLIDKGANPTAKLEGMTPIEWAEAYRSKPVVDVLVKHGAKPVSPKEAAQLRFINSAGRSFEKTAFEQKNIIEMEKDLEDGATVNGKNSKGMTALAEAIFATTELEEYVTVVYLLQKGANPNLESAQSAKETAGLPLHHAVTWMSLRERRGAHEGKRVYSRLAMEALLKAGAHISSRGYDDQTPLHIAAKYNGLRAAEMLIKAGAKIMDKDDTGKTPLDYAESAEMIKLLKSYGAKEL